MSQNNFEFDSQKDGQCAGCPLCQFPPSFWRALLRPPFARRHPVLTILFLLAAAAVIFRACYPAKSNTENVPEQDCIALVKIQGAILEPSATLRWIRRIERQPHVKGVLLRVDSPGGGAAASQEIYAALARLGKKIPIAASMGSTAASGGLMVTMAAQKIYANPSTITGSIGVRMDIPQLQGLMSKIGVGQETLVSGPFKDAASFTRPLSSTDRAYLEGVIMNMHEQFVAIVAKGRGMSHEEAGALANGKIFTGQQAMALNLIDELGGQEECLEWLCARTGVDARLRLWTPETGNSPWSQLLKHAFASMLHGFADYTQQAAPQPAFLFAM